MEQTHGTWGRRIVTREDCHSVTTILYLKPNKRCSWHKHSHAYNQFFVISGELTVKTDIGSREEPQQRNFTTLQAGQFFTVQPGVTHEFRTGAIETVIEEIAYVEFNKHDIHRKLLGGDINNGND